MTLRTRHGAIGVMSFGKHLACLDAGALTALLEHRPDVLVEPVPRSVGELALRLEGVDSLARALSVMNRDQVAVARAVALLGATTLPALAARLGAPETDVAAVVEELCARGLGWRVGGRVGLPDRLAEHFSAEFAGFRPLALIAAHARVEELRTAVTGLGADPTGLRKPELIERLRAHFSDSATIAKVVAGLSATARDHLAILCRSGGSYYYYSRGADGPVAALVRAGLLVTGMYRQPEVPRELVVLLRSGGRDTVSGRPLLAASTDQADDGRAGADAAVLALTTLLDEARGRPLAALKKGGIGTRERNRLTSRLGLTDPALWIDLAHAAGLLAADQGGYAATAGYDAWRDEAPGVRWARIALAWWALELAPTSRETDDGEMAPPMPLESAAGILRRALLRAAAGGRSVRAAGEEID